MKYTFFFFFFQAEDGIRDIGRDWSSDVCSSDLIRGTSPRKAKAMYENQRVADTTTVEVLAREASAHAAQTGIPFEAALEAVLETKVDRQQYGELFDESHRGERAERWQEDLTRERVEERDRARREERSRVRKAE